MGILDDTAIFATIVQRGGFSHAAKHLGLSNGLISRRIAQLESRLGVSLIKRTTRQLQLTPEGELFWEHAQRIQQEIDSALTLIQSLSHKPKGEIRVSSSVFFGRHYLTPIIIKFLNNFSDIKVELILTGKILDPVDAKLDLVIRGIGYLDKTLTESSMKAKLLHQQKINLYASPSYLHKYGEPKTPEELVKHFTIGYVNSLHHPGHETWEYTFKNKKSEVIIHPKFVSNDVESGVTACIAGSGIGKLTELITACAIKQDKLRPILQQYNWGDFHLYAMYPQQQNLPARTRLLLDFITANIKNLSEKNC